MRRPALIAAFVLLTASAPAHAQATGPYYARGTFFCSESLSAVTASDSCWGYGTQVMLYDDGLHGDGAAGDSVYGGWVTCNQSAGVFQFKIANADWTFNLPSAPGYPLENGWLWASGIGDVIHFRLDMSTPAFGWLPAVSVATDHGYPSGATLELIGSAPELGNWTSGVPVDHVGSLWSKGVTIAAAGSYEFKFRVQGTWNYANFGLDYNDLQGRNGAFMTSSANTEMVIQFDELTGRIRAIPNHNVATRTTSWGRVKAAYR